MEISAAKYAGKWLKYVLVLFLVFVLIFTQTTSIYAAPFTAGAAKRDAPGPFATAPIIQGDPNNLYSLQDDLPRIERGTAISGEFYPYFDSNQGSIVFWFTPEYGSDDLSGSGDHFLFHFSNDLHFRYEYDNDRFALQIFNNTSYVNQSIIAGTPYSIVARWDYDNTLDGTNHISLSIDDAHTLSVASPNTFHVLKSSFTIGGQWGVGALNYKAASGTIEGFTVYRRLLYDGTYGVDVGNGDEIAKIYDSDENPGNGITPQDPALVTGSWDVVFALPTNSSTGALTTGTGEAWSHPHSSAILTDTFAQTTYTSSGWGDEVTPVSPSEIEFDGADTVINVPDAPSIQDLADNAFTVEGWIRIDPVGDGSQYIIEKTDTTSSGWQFRHGASQLTTVVRCATDDAIINWGAANSFRDNKWHHFAFTFDDAGDRKLRGYVDGVLVVTSDAGVGAIVSDVGEDLILGYRTSATALMGGIAWLRISDNIRYAAPFTPPSRTSPPADDGNTVSLWKMDEGSGTTVADFNANANDGTLTPGSGGWYVGNDLPQDGPGERIFNWGYVFGVDAANEGITQTLSSLTAGQNYVARVVAHTDTADDIRLRIYDETNGATIVDYDFGGGSSRDSPGVAIITWELPTVARNGVAADSTSMSVKVLGTASGQTVYVHQVEIQENLLDNPSLETWSGADPDISDGWTGVSIDAGELENSAGGGAVIHSGVDAAQYNAAIGANDKLRQTVSGTIGKYYLAGGWFYGDGSKSLWVGPHSGGYGVYHSDPNAHKIEGDVAASWGHKAAVLRATATNMLWNLNTSGTALGNRYLDDVYAIPLDDVSLTVTPANEANSTENTDEIRVDGMDTYVETGQSLQTTTSGYVSFDWRPRHAAANAIAFAQTTGNDAYILSLTDSDNSDYINVFWDSANTLKLSADTGSGENIDTWDATGAIATNTQYVIVLQYSNGGNITISVDGTERLSIAMADAFDEAPDDVYFGSDYSGANQGDATFSEINFDNVSPVVTLTAYSPDPGTDTTPTATGSVTDTSGTVSSVEYQMDGTGGSWIACTADDGTFDEATEAFSCSVSPALTDGEHTIYVRATDNVSNVSTNATDTFTVDTTPPTTFVLDSPGGDSYINEDRPTFRWIESSDETVGLSKYTFRVDNGDTGDFTADDIPVSPSAGSGWTSATEYEVDKYKVSYSGFSDGNDNNNYIELEVKSSSAWGDTENDGALKEGKRTWTVRAIDTVDNTTSISRTLYVDKTSPNTDIIDVNGTPYAENLKTVDTAPEVSGKVTDSLSGESPSSSSEQTRLDNMVAGGPKEVEVRIEKEGLLGVYSLHSLAIVNIPDIYWVDDNTKITDNKKQENPATSARDGKFANYSYTPTEELPKGTFKITVKGVDNAGNGASKSFNLQIGPVDQVITPELEEEIERTIDEEYPESTEEEKKKIKEELIDEVVQETEPGEPNIIAGIVPKIFDTAWNIYFGFIDASKVFAKAVGTRVSNIAQAVWGANQKALNATTVVWNTFSQFSIEISGKSLALVNTAVQGIVRNTSELGKAVGISVATLYNSASENAPGLISDGLIAFGNIAVNINQSVTSAANQVGSLAFNITSVIGGTVNSVGNVATKVGSSVVGIARSAGKSFEEFTEKTNVLIATIGEIYFDKEPTRITDVTVVEVGTAYAIVSWKTNHHTRNNKVNYGEDGSYGSHVFSEERSKGHTARLSGLKPGTKYVFEVMSQNKNYVYDSFHDFTTLDSDAK